MTQPVTTPTSDSRRWYALILLCAAQFMFVLDVAIINVALPSIEQQFQMSPQNLQWVINAYTLAFGGFLMLGGRAADLLGRRRVFMAGLGLFSLASLMGGFAESGGVLIAARGAQGLGAALSSPAVLSILTTTFTEGSERDRALGIWGATGASGAGAGVLLGGVLTATLGWEWVLFVNVPIGIASVLLAPMLIRESIDTTGPRQFDLAGAFCITASLVLLVFTIVNAETSGPGPTIALFALSLLLLVSFVFIEKRSRTPLVPLRIFRLRNLTGANLVSLFHANGPLSTLFFISLYLQQVLGFNALNSGLAFLPFAVTAGILSCVTPMFVNRLGVKQVLVGGLVLMAAGLVIFAQVSVNGSYVRDVLPASLLVAVGAGVSFVPMTVAAVTEVRDEDTGLASGILNTTQQIGAALGLALLVNIANVRTKQVVAVRGDSPEVLPSALTAGFQSAFLVGAALLGVGALIALLVIRQQKTNPPQKVLPI
jgi:EmrB/QacA subfamily drug resistance transporter